MYYLNLMETLGFGSRLFLPQKPKKTDNANATAALTAPSQPEIPCFGSSEGCLSLVNAAAGTASRAHHHQLHHHHHYNHHSHHSHHHPAPASTREDAMGTVAFAFDIDGVLVRGTNALPGAREAIALLRRNRIPFILLTNGGGLTEEKHAERVSLRLGGEPIDERQFVQSHTPFRALVPEYADKTVLVVGGHSQQIRDVAHAYGFRDVVTTSDIWKELEHVHPFPEMTAAHHEQHGRRRSDSVGGSSINSDDPSGAKLQAAPPLQISLIAVFSSPRDWCLDLQVITDLLLSEQGVIGTRSPRNGDDRLPNAGFLQDGQPRLCFCNPDFEWATQHHQPRFAQGAFREALRGVWAHATGGRAPLEYTMCGKPTELTYTYGERMLHEYHQRLFSAGEKSKNGSGDNKNGDDDEETATTAVTAPPPIRTVYMVGDNPESDIAGANGYVSRYGSEWKSILVESGVYVRGTVPAHAPTHIARGVREAVEWALQQEGIAVDFDFAEAEPEGV